MRPASAKIVPGRASAHRVLGPLRIWNPPGTKCSTDTPATLVKMIPLIH